MTQTEPDWTPEERGLLLSSVGGGAHARPLSPAQVGVLFERELKRGVKQATLASVLHLDSAAMIGRFVKVAQLPPDVADAVGWGRSSIAINLTQAQEIARLSNPEDQRTLARLVLEFNLSGSEVRSAVQICLRRGVGPIVGVEETVRLRPAIERRYIQVGQITSAVSASIARYTAEERAALMRRALDAMGLEVKEHSLREHGYALVLDEGLASTLNPDETEAALNVTLASLIGGL